MVSCLLIVFFNIFLFKEKPGILDDLSLKKAQEEVAFRFNTEDRTNPSIKLPLPIRRIGYNKYSIVFKNVSQEIMSFFDTETLFFQEVHPLNQKGFVIFYWPEIFILGITIFYIASKAKKSLNNLPIIFGFLVMSLVYYLTSAASGDRRQVLTSITIVTLMVQGISVINFTKSRIVGRTLTLLILLSVYGWAGNLYDRSVRPDFWLDNRPVAYNFVLTEIRDRNLMSYSKVLVPDTLFATKDYCKMYLSDCSKFITENFNLYGISAQPDVLYVGFTGNFLGLNLTNYTMAEIEDVLNKKNMQVYSSRHILNNIASGYGQELIIAGIKK